MGQSQTDSSVATDVTGVSARAMLAAIIAGEADASRLAELAKGRMRSKRGALEQALTGRVRDHHRYLLAQHLVHLDFLDEQIAELEQQIASMIASDLPVDGPPDDGQRERQPQPPAAEDGAAGAGAGAALAWADAVTLLDTIPGVGRTAAEHLIAEMGTDMGKFASAAHLASWAKVMSRATTRAPASGARGDGAGQPLVTECVGAGRVGGGEGEGLPLGVGVSPAGGAARGEAGDPGGGASDPGGGVLHAARAGAVS